MQKEEVTKESVAYYAGCRILEAVLLNLGCSRDKPVAWLDLTMMSPIRMFALMHLRYDLIIPGTRETATVITMRPKDADRLPGSGIIYRVEFTPEPAPDEGEKHRIAFQALLDQSASMNRHWCGEVEMIRLYHPEADHHNVHCENSAFAPVPHMSLGDVAKALACYQAPPSEEISLGKLRFDVHTGEFEAVVEETTMAPTAEMDPERLEFDIVDARPKEAGMVIELEAESPPPDEFLSRRRVLTHLAPEICPTHSLVIDADHARQLEEVSIDLQPYLIIRV